MDYANKAANCLQNMTRMRHFPSRVMKRPSPGGRSQLQALIAVIAFLSALALSASYRQHTSPTSTRIFSMLSSPSSSATSSRKCSNEVEDYLNAYFAQKTQPLNRASITGHQRIHASANPSTPSHSGSDKNGALNSSGQRGDDSHFQAIVDIKNLFLKKCTQTAVALLLVIPLMGGFPLASWADDELAKYAAEGNTVGVDTNCFFKKCPLESVSCGNDPNCLKGLSCLARCKGGSMCSTGCFAKFGGDALNELLYCSVEKNDCVHVPGKENNGWTNDALSDLPAKPLPNYDINALRGTWYKVMGLDSRYDCFDCQMNAFEVKDPQTLKMEALFRIPRPSNPGYLQNTIYEELHRADQTTSLATLQSQGRMFGLTFWENWYILGDSAKSPSPIDSLLAAGNSLVTLPSANAAASKGPTSTTVPPQREPDFKLVYYTGHTLQGSYKGAFVYSRNPMLAPQELSVATEVIRSAGLNPNDFCMIRNKCFLSSKDCPESFRDRMIRSRQMLSSQTSSASNPTGSAVCMDKRSEDQVVPEEKAPFWYLGQRFFQATELVASELADWFQDPELLSKWLVDQQERMVIDQPLVSQRFFSGFRAVDSTASTASSASAIDAPAEPNAPSTPSANALLRDNI